MGMKTRVSLIVLMVVLVAGIVIYDRKYGQGNEPKPGDTPAIPASTSTSNDPFASLTPTDPLGTTPPATTADPFATTTPGTTTPPTTAMTPGTGPTSTPPPSAGPSTPFKTDVATTSGGRPKPTSNPFNPPPTTNPVEPKGGKKGGKEPKTTPAKTWPFDDGTPPQTSAPATTFGGKTHKVRDGDSLWTIAEEYYKNGTKFKAIEEANRDKLGSGAFLKVGMELVIPDVASSSPSTPPSDTPAGAKEPVAGPGEYKVKSGDSLSSIAKDQLGSESHWELIAKANEDKLEGKPNRLKVGMILRIPEKPAKAEKAEPVLKPGKTPDLKEEPIPADLAGKRTYRVKSGDSLWIIAEREMGSGVKWEKLYEANKSRLPSKTDLKVGHVIVIPD